jgi:hypothetical protein
MVAARITCSSNAAIASGGNVLVRSGGSLGGDVDDDGLYRAAAAAAAGPGELLADARCGVSELKKRLTVPCGLVVVARCAVASGEQ